MKKILFGLVMLLFTSVSAYAGPQDRNLLTGAAVGATAGAVIGYQSEDREDGAVIGAIFGGLAGAFLGSLQPEFVDDAYVDDRESGYGDSEYNGREAYEEHELQGGRYAYRHHGRYSSYRYGDQRENDYNHARHGAREAHARHEAQEARARHEAQEARARHEYDEHHRAYSYGRVNASAGRHRQYYAWMD